MLPLSLSRIGSLLNAINLGQPDPEEKPSLPRGENFKRILKRIRLAIEKNKREINLGEEETIYTILL